MRKYVCFFDFRVNFELDKMQKYSGIFINQPSAWSSIQALLDLDVSLSKTENVLPLKV